MKKIFLTLFSLLVICQLYAQSFEVSIMANSGLFHYSGNATASSSFFLTAQDPKQDYTNDPYGSKNGFSYVAAIQGQYVSKLGIIAGMQAGYEILQSKVSIDTIYEYTVAPSVGPTNYPRPANGQSFLQDQNIFVNPYIGYRLKIKKIKIDLMPGIALGFNINSHENGKATDNSGNVYQTTRTRPGTPTDFGLRFAVALSCKKWGLTAGYTHGLVNYTSNLDENAMGSYGTAQIVRSELLTFGISYRIF